MSVAVVVRKLHFAMGKWSILTQTLTLTLTLMGQLCILPSNHHAYAQVWVVGDTFLFVFFCITNVHTTFRWRCC